MKFTIKQWPAWLKISSIVLALVAIIGITVGVLLIVSPRTPTDTTDTPKVENAEKLLDAYEKSTSIEDRGEKYKKLSISTTDIATSPNPSNVSIFYSNTSRPYEITLPSSTLVQYQLINVAQKINSEKFITSTEKFLQDLGVTKIDSQSVDDLTLTQFEGPTVVCQTDNRQMISEQPATYGLVCINKTEIDSIYKEVGELVGLASGDISSESIASISRVTITDDLGKMIIITAQETDKTSLTLYFTATDNFWQYVGARTTPSVDIKNSFVVPTKLQDAVNNSPNKQLLLKYIM